MATNANVPEPQNEYSNERSPLLAGPRISQPINGIEENCEHEQGADDAAKTSNGVNVQRSASPVTVVLVLIVGVFIAQLDVSYVLTTHSIVASEFGQLSNSSWIILGYSLAMCAVQPLFGKLSDAFGRKECLIIAYTFFAIGSLVCGIANSLILVVLGRVIAGIGGAGANVLVSLILLDLVPLREVASLRSYVNIAATTGRSLGGPIGGFLADTIGWRWSFILQCPLLAVAAILAWFLVPHKDHTGKQEKSILARLARIDFIGAGLLATAITTLMMAVELLGQRLRWNHPILLGLVAASTVSGVLFLATEAYWAPEPVFPLHLLKKRDVVCSYLMLGMQVAAQLGLMFCVPVYFQVTQNASASLAGAHLFPAVGGNAIGSLITGMVIKRTGRYKILAVSATMVAGICYTLLILRWHGDTNWAESLYIIPGGFGSGMAESAIFIGLTASVDPSLHAIALSGLFQSTNIGVIGGLTASSAVLQAVLKRELDHTLTGYKHKQKIIEDAVSSIDYVLHSKGRLRDILVKAYVVGLEYTHGVSLICVAIAFVASLFIRQRNL
ncbi:major facilitator superfamily transporter [Tothia fuscella]|uniref:Major facilitator superfamily transporter n=1 Tax=Tothia fuscella TaxID=1048955 RepID=A0A9P4NYM0_9PEZI|nr:major facilitator superfamily transporter [Tothia fuscella]